MKKIILLFIFFISISPQAQTLDIQSFATGFSSPLDIQNAGDERLFVVERGGIIKIVAADGSVKSTPFLNISDRVSKDGGERGLLGLAFHPEYASNGYFYVDYVNKDGNTQISRFSANTNDPDLADASSEFKLLSVDQPASNHNGGCLAFGPDGYLYIAMGDGGGGGDPQNNAQNTATLLGSLLRIDVNNGNPYAIPADNPFVDNTTGKDEIWAYGLRNPWKFSFDPESKKLWIADVGQNKIEEINRAANNAAGLNYGWRCYEGKAVYNMTNCPAETELTFPLATYSHNNNNRASITGGYVYRGAAFADLKGKYIFADFVSNELAYLDSEDTSEPEITYSESFAGTGFSSFGLDAAGELYVAGLSSGTIYKVVDADALAVKSVQKDAFGLYPNPARDKLKINIDPSVNLRAAKITVFDLLGKKMKTYTLALRAEPLDISELKRGVYLVQLSNETGILGTEKLIVK